MLRRVLRIDDAFPGEQAGLRGEEVAHLSPLASEAATCLSQADERSCCPLP
jgi:hypothetical protein